MNIGIYRSLLVLFVLSGWTPILARAEIRVLFCSDKEASSNVFDLYTLRVDGTDLRRLTTTPEVSEWAPALAPNGQRLAYVAREPRTIMGLLYVMDLATATPVKVAIPGQALAVQWADDNTLYYLGLAGWKWGQPFFDVRKVNVDGTGETPVYAGPFWVYAVGADRFTLWRSGGRLLFTTSGSTPESGPITLRSGSVTAAAPDTVYASGIETLYDPSTQKEPRVPGDSLIDHYDLTLAPDGSRLAYCADHGSGYHRLYVRDGTGEAATQRRLSDAFCGDPDFAPDGSFLVFTRATNSTYGISPYVGDLIRIDVDGANESNLSGGVAAISGRCAHPVVYAVGGSVVAPFRLQPLERPSEGGVRLTWPSQAGSVYQVEYSDNLATWRQDLPASRFTAQPGETTLQFVDPSLSAPRRFYRILAPSQP